MRDDGLAELRGRRVRVLVQPAPGRHVDEGDAGDLARRPERRRARAASRRAASGPARPSSSRSRAWNTKASASVKAVLGTPCSSVWSIVVEREDLLDVVAHLVDGDVVALVVHPVLADARAQVRLVVAPGRRRWRGRRRATGSTTMRSARKRARSAREAEVLQEARDVGRVGGRRRVALAASSRRARPRRSFPRGLKPAYQMSNGSSLRPSRFSIEAPPPARASGESSTASSSACDLRLGDLAVRR